jgi:hypothetical protein
MLVHQRTTECDPSCIRYDNSRENDGYLDSANTTFLPVNLYNVMMPLPNIGINRDDGLLIGAGFERTEHEGFRKYPFAKPISGYDNPFIFNQRFQRKL